MTTAEHTERNRVLQQELYGEALSVLLSRVGDALGCSQAKLADVLGLSPAMLSQLRTAQRVKIGNPAVVERLRALDDLAQQMTAGQLDQRDVDGRIVEIRSLNGLSPRTNATSAHPLDARSAVRVISALLRAVASADELLDAANRLEADQPALAEVLRVYGAGRSDAALAHFERVSPLL